MHVSKLSDLLVYVYTYTGPYRACALLLYDASHFHQLGHTATTTRKIRYGGERTGRDSELVDIFKIKVKVTQEVEMVNRHTRPLTYKERELEGMDIL